VPTDVIGLGDDIQAIAVSQVDSCALTKWGGVKCWGFVYDDGSVRQLPIAVEGVTDGIRAISAGTSHTCAIMKTGGLKCWGYNGYGQLGDGTQETRAAAVYVVGLTAGVEAVSGGGSGTCAVTTAGSMKCWGYNHDGQLGNGTTTNSDTPVDVAGLGTGVQSASSGTYHNCALMADGGVKCWGSNGDGQLGDRTRDGRLTPVNVTQFRSDAQQVSAGGRHTCGLTADGTMSCWGNSDYGREVDP
jgi:alpha-tubulin suppressor-like RCC1 family protein